LRPRSRVVCLLREACGLAEHPRVVVYARGGLSLVQRTDSSVSLVRFPRVRPEDRQNRCIVAFVETGS
jgi:hypothetical protein